MSKRFHLRESSSSGSDPPSPFQTTPPREVEYYEIKISTNQFGAWLILHSGISRHFFYTRPGDVFVIMNPDATDPKHYIVKVMKRGGLNSNIANTIFRMDEFVATTTRESVVGGSPEETEENLNDKMSEFFPYWVLNTFDRNFLLRYYEETFDYGYPAQFDDLDEARIESEETSGGEGSSEPVAKKPKK